MSLTPRRINQIGLAVCILAVLVILDLMLAFIAPAAARHAREHSIKQWGSTVSGTITHKGPIESSDGGPVRLVRISFAGKYGETQSVSRTFYLSQITEQPTVWQRKDTGRIFVTHQADDLPYGTPSETRATPFYSGGMTQLGFSVLGVLIAVGAWIIIAFVAWLVADNVREKQRRKRIHLAAAA